MLRRLLRPLAVSGAATLATLVAVELVFQFKPEWLPVAYRRSLPLKGQELIAPEIARGTPAHGVALPTAMWDYDGPAPADLIEMGLAPPSARDAEPARVLLTLDRWGLPNAEVPENADVVLLGDSFVYSMGMQDPPGLAQRLTAATGLRAYCAGVTGIGPYQELYLLERIALPLQPERVVWFVFGGNDLQGAGATLAHREAGRESLMDRLWPAGPPRLRLRDLARWMLQSTGGRPPGPGHPGVAVSGGSSEHLAWFHPEYTSALAVQPEFLDEWPAYLGLLECLENGADLCRAAGTDLWVVFLPSKAECYLPLLDAEQEAALVEQCFFGREAPPRESWPDLVAQMRSHLGALGGRLGAECAARGIRFFDATEALREEMAAGRPPYFAADTHLGLQGQARLLKELVERWDAPTSPAAAAGQGADSEG
jgi:hypothetical protein